MDGSPSDPPCSSEGAPGSPCRVSSRLAHKYVISVNRTQQTDQHKLLFGLEYTEYVYDSADIEN